jgi:hypothetical protein
MRLRPLDWCLLAIAAAAIVAGFVLNGPMCEITFCPDAPCPCIFHFPTQIAAGLAVALLALVIVAVRARGRSN